MSATTLLLLQSLLVSLQTVNAGLAAFQQVPPWASLSLAAIIGGLQYFTQHAGNQLVPAPPAQPK